MHDIITVENYGNFTDTNKFLANIRNLKFNKILQKYGKLGVSALREATPTDTGETADAWDYEIVQNGSTISLYFTNDKMAMGVPIVILLQYGHATKNGGWVEGIDFINPALKPLFDKIAKDAWKEVTKR